MVVGSDQESEDKEPAHIYAGGDGAHDEGQGKGSDAARGERESGLHRGVIEQGFKILRKQDHAGVEAEADQRHQQHSDGEGAVFEGAQIDNWIVDGQLADDEEQQSYDAAECLDADFARAEPVLALSGIEEDLQRSEAEGEQADTPEIHVGIALALDVRRIVDVARHHHEREDAHRDVEVEDPSPGVVVGDPAAEGGADDGRDDDAESVGGHCLTMFFFRKCLQQDGLGEGLQTASGEALQYTEDDELGQAAGESAEQGSDGESGNTGQQHSAASEVAGQPPGHGQDDGVGHQVGGDHPGSFLVGGAEIS